MIQISHKQASDRFDTLPDKLKDVGFSANSVYVIDQACVQNHLSEDKQAKISQLVGYVLFGFIHPEDLSREIQEALSINSEITNTISVEINRKIFAPVRNDLDKVYAPVPSTVTAPSSQVAPENIINLKTASAPAAIKPGIPPTPAQAPTAPQASSTVSVIGGAKEGAAEKTVEVIPPTKLEEKLKEHEAPFILHKEEAEIKPTTPPAPDKRSLGGLFWFLGGKGKGEKEEIKAEVQLEKPQATIKAEPIRLVGTPPTAPKIVHYTEARPPVSPFGAGEVKPIAEIRPISPVSPKPITPTTGPEEPKEVSIPIIGKATPSAPPKPLLAPPLAPSKPEPKTAEPTIIRKDFKAEPLPAIKQAEPVIIPPQPLPKAGALPQKEEKPGTLDLSVFKNIPDYGVRPKITEQPKPEAAARPAPLPEKKEFKPPEPIMHPALKPVIPPAAPRIEPEMFKPKEPPKEVREIIKEAPKSVAEVKKVEEVKKPEEKTAKQETPIINIYIAPEAAKGIQPTKIEGVSVKAGIAGTTSQPPPAPAQPQNAGAPAVGQPQVVERVIERIIEKTASKPQQPPKKYSFEELPPGTFMAPAPPPPPQKPKPTSANFPENKRPHDDNVIDLRTFEIKKEGQTG